MKNNNSIFNFNTKYLKTGGYSVLISIVAIAIVVVINLFVNKLPESITKIDTTASGLHSIGEKTVSTVKELDEEVTIYYVATYGTENNDIQSMLKKYQELNEKVKVEQIDPSLNPTFFSGDKAEVTEGCVVVESAKRSKIITVLEIFYPGYTEEMINYYYYNGVEPPRSFALEKNLTSAIKYVTTEDIPNIYALKGHGEIELPEDYVEEHIRAESMELKSLNLVTLDKVPDDCDCIMITVPETDITKEEAEKILTYLKSGGKLMLISSYSNTVGNNHVNLKSVLNYYGVDTVEGYVVEGGNDYKLPGTEGFLIPLYGNHDIVDPLKGVGMILGGSQGIKKTEDIRSTVTVTPLLSTSSESYSKLGTTDITQKDDGDIAGPFDIAVAINEANADGSETKIVWINDPLILVDNIDLYGSSSRMVTNSLGWMCEIDSAVSIPEKRYEYEILEINEVQSNILVWVFAVIIPISVIAVGFVVIYRRRSK